MICFSVVVSIFTWYMTNRYGLIFGDFWTHAFYYSSMCFAWGIVLHEYYDEVVCVLVNKRVVGSIALLLVGVLSCVCLKMPKESFVGGVVLHNLVGMCVMTVIVIWCHFVDIKQIPLVGGVVEWLTRYSTEIYLYQFVFLAVYKEYYEIYNLKIDFGYVMAVTVTTILVAMLMRKVHCGMSNVLDRI